MPEVETLEAAASEEILEQPASEQAEVEATEEVQTEDAPVETETATESEPAPELLAGKYTNQADLITGYKNLNAEASRMAARIAELERGQTKPAETKPQYSTDQLESFKETRIREVSRYDLAADRFRAEGRHAEANQAEQLAVEAARQVRLIDAELRKIDIQSTIKQSASKDAESRLLKEAVEIVRGHAAELVPGTKLYTKANEYLSGYGAMGMDTDSPLVQAQAVAMAVQVLGLSSTKVEQKTRKELTKTMNQALKAGVQAGAGKGAKSASAPNFLDMSDEEFIAYKAKRGWN